jgi:ABC-type maltose transport system permease subunit
MMAGTKIWNTWDRSRRVMMPMVVDMLVVVMLMVLIFHFGSFVVLSILMIFMVMMTFLSSTIAKDCKR